jgi:hypothetical protein
MKRILLSLMVLFSATLVWAGSNTTNLSLYKPVVGDRNWGTLINNNWNTLDTAVGTKLNANGTFKTGAISVADLPDLSGSYIAAETDPQVGTLTATKWCIANGTGTAINCTEDTPGAGSGIVTAVGDCSGGACYDGTSDGGTYLKFYDVQGYGQLITGDLTTDRVWTMPDATGTVALTTSTVSAATTAVTATALVSNGANCSANQAPLGVNASGAVEGCFAVLTGASIDTSSELGAILTDETGNGTGVGKVVFSESPTITGTVTAAQFVGGGAGLTGLSTAFTTSAGLAALISDETGTGVAVFGTSPSFTTKINMPNAAAPTEPNLGDINLDTNYWASGQGALLINVGNSLTTLLGVVTTSTPSDGYVPKYVASNGTITWQADSGGSITGADTEVTFFDGADTPAGDSGLTYNKTTNILTADGFTAAQATTPGYVQLFEGSGNGTNSFKIITDANMTADTTWTLPSGGVQTVQHSAAPTMTIEGNIGIDTTADQLVYYGSTIKVLDPTYQKSFALETPTSSDINIPIWTPKTAVTITGWNLVSVGNTIRMHLGDGTNNTESIVTAVAGTVVSDDGTMVNNTFTALEPVRISVDGANAATTWVEGTIYFTPDRL